jgi:Ca2+-binding RTX toxin-like protein
MKRKLIMVLVALGALVLIGTAAATATKVIRGTAANDNLIGTANADTIYGHAGNDFIGGRGGNDTLFGGTGDDTIHGGPGNDTIHGGPGNDKLWAGDGRDTLRGDDGNDTLYALAKDATHDFVDCGPGDDTAYVRGGVTVHNCEHVIRESSAQADAMRAANDDNQ